MTMPEDEKVERVNLGDMAPEEKPHNAGGLRQLVIQAVVSAVVTIAILAVWALPQTVSKKDYDVVVKSLSADVTQLQGSVAALSAVASQISQINGNINSLTSEVSSLRSSLGNYTTSGQVSSMMASGLASIQQNITSLNTQISALAKSSDVSSLQVSVNELQTKVTKLRTDVDVLNGGTITTTTGTGSTSGSIVASISNSPMRFVAPITGAQTHSFGLKFVNNYSDKDLSYVNVTVKMTIANLSAFVLNGNPALVSGSGTFTNWEYDSGSGSTVTFTSDAWVSVSRGGGDFYDTQKLTLYGDATLTGTYTVTVNSITINSKTLQ